MPEIAEAALRLAIYARVSTEEQREGQTIDSQIAELERFSRDKGWPIAGVYKDEGWSGGMMERPALDRLRDDAQNGVFLEVLIIDVDLLARDVAHLGFIKRYLERKGMKVIFRKLPSDTSPTSNLMVNILGSFAEFERELISDRTRRGRQKSPSIHNRSVARIPASYHPDHCLPWRSRQNPSANSDCRPQRELRGGRNT
jgi:DNA invertase Pin-like site-specific DNA recombinase